MKNFLIIPGLPRCATTSFFQILGQHPQVFLPKIKEPHYFLPNKDEYFMFNRKGEKIPFNKSGFLSTEKEFNDNYENFTANQLYIDGSTLYSVHTSSINQIFKQKDINPLFVILKRSPFKRAVSHYLYSVSRGEEFRKFDEALKDEQTGLHKNWLLKGYMAGSNSLPCEKAIVDLWSESKLISADIGVDNVFSQAFMDKILTHFKLDNFEFDFNETANSLTYTNKPVINEIRILLKRIRQLNPKLLDNKLTRALFQKFMKSISTNNDIYEQYNEYEGVFNEYFNKCIAK